MLAALAHQLLLVLSLTLSLDLLTAAQFLLLALGLEGLLLAAAVDGDLALALLLELLLQLVLAVGLLLTQVFLFHHLLLLLATVHRLAALLPKVHAPKFSAAIAEFSMERCPARRVPSIAAQLRVCVRKRPERYYIALNPTPNLDPRSSARADVLMAGRCIVPPLSLWQASGPCPHGRPMFARELENREFDVISCNREGQLGALSVTL